MNTVEDLINNGICIEPYTAEMMVQAYQSKIGFISGINRVVDVNYVYHDAIKDVTLECTSCGRISHSMIKNSKWGKLRKTCPCQKERKEAEKAAFLERVEAETRDAITRRIGETRGDYKVMSATDIDTDSPKYALRCVSCGNEKLVSAKPDVFDHRKNFHCTKCYNPIKYDESYVGKKNNFLEVVGISRTKSGHRMFDCRCICGKVKQIEPMHWAAGIVKSCGCKHDELTSKANTIHGHSGDRLYSVWRGMIDRCHNKNATSYCNYGGRGITVCPEWRKDFMAFHDWATAAGYDYDAERGECTIDRKDVNGNYEPSNCRWITIVEQQKNKRPPSEWRQRKKKTWTIDGVTKPQIEWCREYGVEIMTVKYRIRKMGLRPLEALTVEKLTDGRPKKTAVVV